MAQNAPAAVFEKIEHEFKALLAAVVGIRHLGLLVVGAELAEQSDFGAEL
jgi:hypothetical protein